MSTIEATLVETARSWIDVLCKEEAKRPGDYGDAMRRVASDLGLPRGFLSEMRHRPPKSISAGRFFRLSVAHDECLQRQKYREARSAFQPNTALGRFVARAADYLAGEETGD